MKAFQQIDEELMSIVLTTTYRFDTQQNLRVKAHTASRGFRGEITPSWHDEKFFVCFYLIFDHRNNDKYL